MTIPKIRIIDGGIVLDRDMDAEEIVILETIQAETEAQAESQAARVIARQEVLDRLGITAEEAQLLLGGI